MGMGRGFRRNDYFDRLINKHFVTQLTLLRIRCPDNLTVGGWGISWGWCSTSGRRCTISYRRGWSISRLRGRGWVVYSNLWRRYFNLCHHHMLPLWHGTFPSVHKHEENAGTAINATITPVIIPVRGLVEESESEKSLAV